MTRRQVRFNNYHRSIKMHLLRQSTLCGLCHKPIETLREATIDHIIPLSMGGADGVHNMQVAHEVCNLSKGNVQK